MRPVRVGWHDLASQLTPFDQLVELLHPHSQPGGSLGGCVVSERPAQLAQRTPFDQAGMPWIEGKPLPYFLVAITATVLWGVTQPKPNCNNRPFLVRSLPTPHV